MGRGRTLREALPQLGCSSVRDRGRWRRARRRACQGRRPPIQPETPALAADGRTKILVSAWPRDLRRTLAAASSLQTDRPRPVVRGHDSGHGRLRPSRRVRTAGGFPLRSVRARPDCLRCPRRSPRLRPDRGRDVFGGDHEDRCCGAARAGFRARCRRHRPVSPKARTVDLPRPRSPRRSRRWNGSSAATLAYRRTDRAGASGDPGGEPHVRRRRRRDRPGARPRGTGSPSARAIDSWRCCRSREDPTPTRTSATKLDRSLINRCRACRAESHGARRGPLRALPIHSAGGRSASARSSPARSRGAAPPS